MKPIADSLPQQQLRKLPANSYLSSHSRGEKAVRSALRPAHCAIAAIDSLLRLLLEIHEFTWDPRCILRYSKGFSRSAVTLPTGECVRRGDPILELHFWNERLRSSPLPLRAALCTSFELLAHQLREKQCFAGVKAIHGILARGSRRPCGSEHRLGCSMYVMQRRESRHVHDLFEDILIHLPHWIFNPRGARPRNLRLSRVELWISASELKGLGEKQIQTRQIDLSFTQNAVRRKDYANFNPSPEPSGD